MNLVLLYSYKPCTQFFNLVLQGWDKRLGVKMAITFMQGTVGFVSCDLDSSHFVQSSQNQGSGQQCCYNNSGAIVTGPPGGGTVDLVAPVDDDSREQHFNEDVLPFLYCCKFTSNCREYYKHRPSDNCSRYRPPVPGKFLFSVEPLHTMLHN